MEGNTRNRAGGTRAERPETLLARKVTNTRRATRASAARPVILTFREIIPIVPADRTVLPAVTLIIPPTSANRKGGYGEAQGFEVYGFCPAINIMLFGMSAPNRSPPPSVCRISVSFWNVVSAISPPRINGE